MWKMTHDMGHMTCNWTREVNLLSEFQLPISYVLVVKVISRYSHNENLRKRFWLTKKACTKKSTLAITKPPAAASPNLLELLWQLKLLGVVDRWLVTGDKQQVTHGTWHVSHGHFFFFCKTKCVDILASVLLSAQAERLSVSRMGDFFPWQPN